MNYFLIIISILFSFAFSSCKKNYNCRCSTTIIIPSTTQATFYTKNTPITKKMTKKQAVAVCAHEAESMKQTYTNYFTNNGNWSLNGIVISSICSIE